MYILRILFSDLSDRPQRLSLHANEESALRALFEYVRDNWSEVSDGDDAPRDDASDSDMESFIEEYFDSVGTDRFVIESVYLAGPDPFDTIAALHGLVKSFVRERIESIADEASIDDSFVVTGDFETLEGVDDDTRDRIGHVRFFLTEANRLASRHGIAPLSP